MGLPAIRRIVLQDIGLGSTIGQVVVVDMRTGPMVVSTVGVVVFRVVKMWTVIMCMRMSLWL